MLLIVIKLGNMKHTAMPPPLWMISVPACTYMYSGGKKNPDLPIKSTENLNMTCRHCKRLVTTPTDVVLRLYSQLYEIALRILYIRCCELNYIHF